MILRYMPKIKKEEKNLIRTIRIYSEGIGLGFGIEKSAIFKMEKKKKKGKRNKKRNRETTKEIELPNQENFRTLR